MQRINSVKINVIAFKAPHHLCPPHPSLQELNTNSLLIFDLLKEVVSSAEAIHLQMRYVRADDTIDKRCSPF